MNRFESAINVRPPVAGEVYSRDWTAASVRHPVPAAWRGKYVTFVSDGGKGYVAFGDRNVTATPGTRSSAGTTDADGAVPLTPVAQTSRPLADGSELHVCFDDLALTHFAVIAADPEDVVGAWTANLSSNV